MNSARIATPDFDAVIVGAGFSGLCMLYRLRQIGMSARVFETAPDVGGTWYWNRYPGARVDVESLEYSFSFSEELQQEWSWSERYAPQPELLRYANHVADRFDLRRDIQLETRVTSALYDESANVWVVTTDRGERVTARYCIMGTGILSAPKPPEIPGLETFAGERYHTAMWPQEAVDFTGKRVGVIGTGSSGVQCIPIIAEQARHLTVFQRTPVYSVPARNRPMNRDLERAVKADYAALRQMERESFAGFVMVNDKPSPASMVPALSVSAEERKRVYDECWRSGGLCFYFAFADLFLDMEANNTVAQYLADKIRERVHDPVIAEKLVPSGFPFGAKRLCADTNYYETYNRDNVKLVDIRETPIDAVTPRGVIVGGREIALDVLVTATGFDAVTGAMSKVDIRGRDGVTFNERNADGPRSMLGIMNAGFPNFFTIGGALSTSALTQSIVSIEYHTQWIADAISHTENSGRATIEPTAEAEDAWVKLVNATVSFTLFPRANSWYMGANVPGKPRRVLTYVAPFAEYRRQCDEIAAKGYEGFMFGAAAPKVRATA